MTIGLIGLGRMGAAIVQRLVAQGEDVVGWDISDAALSAAAGPGFRAAASAAEVADAAAVILSIVTEDKGVRRLYRGPGGLLAGPVSGKLFVEMSTLQPATVRELGAEIGAAGGHFVEAPVLGTIPSVRDGKLLALAGGSEEDVALARATLRHLTRDVIRMGPVGQGCAMKLAVNLVMAGYLQSVAEALALGTSQGLEVGEMLAILGQSPTANPWLVSKLPALMGEEVDTTLDIATLRKDVMSAVGTGATAGVPMPLAAGALASLSAAVAGGWGGRDLAHLPGFFRAEMLQAYGYD